MEHGNYVIHQNTYTSFYHENVSPYDFRVQSIGFRQELENKKPVSVCKVLFLLFMPVQYCKTKSYVHGCWFSRRHRICKTCPLI